MKYSDQFADDPSIVFYKALKKVCKATNVKAVPIGAIGRYKFLKMEINPEAERTVLITAGIHGDEPAGPYGILKWLMESSCPEDIRIICLPLTNPTGFDDHDRHNANGRDLNRGFNKKMKPSKELEYIQEAINGESISMLLSLHEDRGHGGVYLYHAGVDTDACEELLAHCGKLIPVVSEESIYGDPCYDGMIEVSRTNSDPKHRNSLENTLQSLGVAQITFETPALADLDLRCEVHKRVIDYVINKIDDFMK